jgi:hypothetical protein
MSDADYRSELAERFRDLMHGLGRPIVGHPCAADTYLIPSLQEANHDRGNDLGGDDVCLYVDHGDLRLCDRRGVGGSRPDSAIGADPGEAPVMGDDSDSYDDWISTGPVS